MQKSAGQRLIQTSELRQPLHKRFGGLNEGASARADTRGAAAGHKPSPPPPRTSSWPSWGSNEVRGDARSCRAPAAPPAELSKATLRRPQSSTTDDAEDAVAPRDGGDSPSPMGSRASDTTASPSA